jgi:hypothetical protein
MKLFCCIFFFMLEVEILSSKNGNWVSMDDGPNLLGRTNLWPEALEGHGWLFLEIISADKATMLSLAPFTQKKSSLAPIKTPGCTWFLICGVCRKYSYGRILYCINSFRWLDLLARQRIQITSRLHVSLADKPHTTLNPLHFLNFPIVSFKFYTES